MSMVLPRGELMLVEPHPGFRDAFLDMALEFYDAGEGWREYFEGFDNYLERIQNLAMGRNLPEGIVPASEFWLMDAGGKLIGRCGIRHHLNESLRLIGGHIGYAIRPSQRRKGYGTAILRLALEKARALGITCVLITCNKKNIASAKIIQKNGGQFEGEDYLQAIGGIEQRYWIDNE